MMQQQLIPIFTHFVIFSSYQQVLDSLLSSQSIHLIIIRINLLEYFETIL